MSFVPVIIMNIILLVITILLSIADRLLVNYGECKITVEKDEVKTEFVVQGGVSLLTSLIDNKIEISSSCAGKASCGYCKVNVASGGGQILPTEEIFMSREEKQQGVRLACQVKVKNDIEILIPDYLTTVRNIVKNKSYDTKLRWEFVRPDREYPEQRVIVRKIKTNEKEKIDAILNKFKDKEGNLIPILQDISRIYRYLPENVLNYISEELKIPFSMVFRVATFYNYFSLNPKGKNILRVCNGTACYVKHGDAILKAVKKALGVNVEETTSDDRYTLETVSCVGCCGQAPVITVNDDIYGYIEMSQLDKIINKY